MLPPCKAGIEMETDRIVSKTLGELHSEIDRNDQWFKSFCSGFDTASRLAGDTTSDYSDAQLAWLWGHYTGQIDDACPKVSS